jgi:hypothetical protein
MYPPSNYRPQYDPPPAPGLNEPETDGVAEWRYAQLLGAGWPDGYAVLLAAADVDLHSACHILGRGCPVELAWRILT